MISVNVKTNTLHNTLLLIDEPEIGLHPSGVRHLCDELIKISKTNYVVYSTHSIFMIDSEKTDRHFIVKKKQEITHIECAAASNIADEEVLYQALGHSIFSILKEKNIIFEGWKDKHLFSVALGNTTAVLKQKYKDVGICHAKGAKSVKAITPMIELTKRNCLILSDSDDVAKNCQKEHRKEKIFGDWKVYQEINPSIEAITGEDFVKNSFIAKQVSIAMSGMGKPLFSETLLPEKKDKLSTISKWLTNNGMNKEHANVKLAEIKNLIFDNLKHQHIDEIEYLKLLEGIEL